MRLADSVQDMIDDLHEDVIARKVTSPIALIRENYRVPHVIAPDFDSFKALLA